MSLRRIRAIAVATAVEALSEPLSLLIMIASVAISALAPAVHYHQFGDPTRMARDAGFSSLLLGGAFYAASAAITTFRREVESGTMLLAMSHSVSRSAFFLAKVLGILIAVLAFSLTVAAASLTAVNGAAISGAIAAVKCDIARIWGPSLALALAVVIVPLIAAAALNRFARWRFTLTANLLALLVAILGASYRFDASLAGRILPVSLISALPVLCIVTGSASAFAVRWRFNLAATLTALALLAFVPALGSYCLSDALNLDGAITPAYVLAAMFSAFLALAAFLSLGVMLVNGKDDL